jgi:hypothetical protein
MMSITRLPPTLDWRHHNRQLFTDGYLDVALPQRGARMALRDEAAPVRARVRALLAAFKPSTNEARSDREPGRPARKALGHCFEIQAPLRNPRGHEEARRPHSTATGPPSARTRTARSPMPPSP